jgi:hypothetical protein
MGLSNNKLKQKQTMRDLVELESLSPPSRTLSLSSRTLSPSSRTLSPSSRTLSPSSRTLSSLLEIIPDEIFLAIFIMLDVWSIGAVLKTCRRFKSITYGSNKKLFITVKYIVSNSTALDMKLVRDLIYPLEFQFRNSGLLLLLEFKPVDPESETESSSGYSVNVLLWVEKSWVVTNKALESLRWFISKISEDAQTPIILLLKGDTIFSKDEKLLQKVRELRSLKVLSVIDGSPEYWSKLNSFNELQLVYFVPKEQYIRDEKLIYLDSITVWTINTQETTFIVNSTGIEIICPDNLV